MPKARDVFAAELQQFAPDVFEGLVVPACVEIQHRLGDPSTLIGIVKKFNETRGAFLTPSWKELPLTTQIRVYGRELFNAKFNINDELNQPYDVLVEEDENDR